MSQDRVKKLKVLWRDVKKQLTDMKERKNITIDQLLTNLKLTEDEYILAIRSSRKDHERSRAVHALP